MTAPVARVSSHLLLVEDEESLALTLSDRLEAEGYVVEHCIDGESALTLLESQPIDVMILDLMLPGIDGFEVCRELRQRGLRLPVLMLTARSEVVDKVVGLKLGADDYLTKPFEMAELLARLEALLRRTTKGQTGSQLYDFGDLRVDFRRAEITREGEPVSLSSMEFRLLQEFIEHRGEVLSREHLLDEVWGYEATPYSRTVDVHVASLRQKLEPTPSHPRFIITVHRRGYRFDG
ncbi:MAG: response regulator transcription factor [bacterium]|nr:response regulator transcription factor [bacterium]